MAARRIRRGPEDWMDDRPLRTLCSSSSSLLLHGNGRFFFGRIDYQDFARRMNTSNMELLWKPRTALDEESSIFAHVTYRGYEAPKGFCIDSICPLPDDPIMDDPNLQGFNIDERAKNLVAYFKDQCLHYKNNDIMHTWGSDFHYRQADENFKAIDKLMSYINNKAEYGVELIYSTPSIYLNEINKKSMTYEVKNDDFFPYADGPDAFWGGYFTSRSNSKGFIRDSGRRLQTYKKFLSLAALRNTSSYVRENFDEVDIGLLYLEEAVAINQHHDAITGTEREAVVGDYHARLNQGLGYASREVETLAIEETKKEIGESPAAYSECHLNKTANYCVVAYENLNANKPVLLKVYNPSAVDETVIRVKVPSGKVAIINEFNANVESDVICANEKDKTDCDLFFRSGFPVYGSVYFKIVPQEKSREIKGEDIVPWFEFHREFNINTKETLRFSKDYSGFTIKSCADTQSNSKCYTHDLKFAFEYYESYARVEGEHGNQNSGAYILRPSNRTKTKAKEYATVKNGKIYQGKIVTQVALDWQKVQTDFRIYGQLSHGIEIETFVDSIDIDDDIGKEIILKVKSQIHNQGVFYTDSNGMEMQKRQINKRETWELNVTQPVAGNYYPINSAIKIADAKGDDPASMIVLNDRPQGGSALNDGEVEFMIQRRILEDDARGVEEPLNETDPDGEGMRLSVQHVVLINKPGFITRDWRQIQYSRDQAPMVLYAPTSSPSFIKDETPKPPFNLDFLPVGVKFFIRALTLNSFLVRFHNSLDSGKVEFSVSGDWRNLQWSERSLTNNMDRETLAKSKLTWNGVAPQIPVLDDYKSGNIALRAQEIRTFLLTRGDSDEKETEKPEREDVTESVLVLQGHASTFDQPLIQ
eukprot:TRINITY_DN2303_c0_g1_i16.p1 TRINITY_DN2303_c0_g1~~TRINITY_DN2303_c0_g1_i16.p1  ORF type:complete len:874 (-),score=283.75 TRINITY_DN2303_c0_g1_i16:239-2860(-)